MASEYERALARAYAEHIRVLGWSESDGWTRWTVANDDKGTLYTVSRRGDGPLSCACDAGVRGKLCKHIAKVRASLAPREPERRPTADELAADRRAASALYRPVTPFSPWK
jgi:hypothetical protein